VDPEDITDITAIAPHEFLAMTRGAPDRVVERVIRGLGTQAVLDRVFAGFADQLVPARAPKGRTVVQWEVRDAGVAHLRALVVDGGRCVVEEGEHRDADVRLTADLVGFVRLLEGSASAPVMLLKRRLGLKGSKALALQLDGMFARPRG
jgi:predicted lipid carrier protein YhbT